MELTVEEVGGHNCTVLRQDGEKGAIATVVLRASTDNLLDDLERAIDDGVNSYKVTLHLRISYYTLRIPQKLCCDPYRLHKSRRYPNLVMARFFTDSDSDG